MPSAPEFSSLVVSRPRSGDRVIMRLRGLAFAASLYASGLAALVLTPLLLLDVVDPPRAGINLEAPPIRFHFQQPRGGGDDRRAGAIRKGVRDGRRHATPPTTPKPAAARAALRPVDAPVPPPETEMPETAAPAHGDGASDGPLGDPRGKGTRSDGVLDSDCIDCPGTGPAGPEDSDGPYEQWATGLIPPSLIPGTRALPGYPDLARRAGLQGTVILLIVVEADGTVGEIEVVKSPDQRWGFDLASINAVKRWRYRPARMNDRPVAAYIQVMVEFSLAR
jgi:periplasmic protein TonB